MSAAPAVRPATSQQVPANRALSAPIRTPAPGTGWWPVLEDAQLERASACIGTVVQALHSASEAPFLRSDPTLAGGYAGQAVFLAYAGQAAPAMDAASSPPYLEAARAYMDAAADALADQDLRPSFFSGFVGIAWAYTHCERAIYGDCEPTAADDLDVLVLHLLRRKPWPFEYDLMNGLVGVGVYALERLPHARALEALELVVARLQELSTESAQGIFWRTAPRLLPPGERERYPTGWTNLGVSHGIPAVIALLAAIAGAGVALAPASRLLDGAVDWMWTQRLPAGRGGCFPTLVDGYHPDTPSRPAWCYGDVGIAGALTAAGRQVDHPRLRRLAAEVGAAAARLEPDHPDVLDSGLCHGWAGVGHVFNRLLHATGDEVFLQPVRAWFDRALHAHQARQGFGGYRAWSRLEDGQPGWTSDAGLLTGAAGVAAALLAATTAVQPDWDRALLLSFRPPRA